MSIACFRERTMSSVVILKVDSQSQFLNGKPSFQDFQEATMNVGEDSLFKFQARGSGLIW